MTVMQYVNMLCRSLSRRVSVGLIGFGVTNRAVYSRLRHCDCELTVRQREHTAIQHGCRGIFGEHYLDGIDEDVLFLSPTVRRDAPELIGAHARGVILTSECEVFFAGEDRPLTLVVTGSDGKSTVTKMASEMLGAAAVGNIGVPYSLLEGEDRYVCELSSFNLNCFSPRSDGCVITNVTPNHLNWHSSLSEYISSKANALKNSQRAVLCADDEISRGFIRGGETLFSLKKERRELCDLGAAFTVYLSDGTVYIDDEPIINARELSQGQSYNILNFMAAIGLVHRLVDPQKMREVGRNFSPLAHRCEVVHSSCDGVTFIDSSIDTTPQRTKNTLEGLGRRVLLLLGGRGKGLSYEPMLDAIGKYALAVAAYGDAAEDIAELFQLKACLRHIPFSSHLGFDDALTSLVNRARNGQTVLLSPSATGYGEFLNFEKRGERFATLAKLLRP